MSVVPQNFILLSVILLSIIMLSVMLSVFCWSSFYCHLYVCHFVQCHSAECHSVRGILLCHFAESYYFQCYIAECHSVHCHSAIYHTTESCYSAERCCWVLMTELSFFWVPLSWMLRHPFSQREPECDSNEINNVSVGSTSSPSHLYTFIDHREIIH
jgi:hypothetical protein